MPHAKLILHTELCWKNEHCRETGHTHTQQLGFSFGLTAASASCISYPADVTSPDKATRSSSFDVDSLLCHMSELGLGFRIFRACIFFDEPQNAFQEYSEITCGEKRLHESRETWLQTHTSWVTLGVLLHASPPWVPCPHLWCGVTVPTMSAIIRYVQIKGEINSQYLLSAHAVLGIVFRTLYLESVNEIMWTWCLAQCLAPNKWHRIKIDFKNCSVRK